MTKIRYQGSKNVYVHNDLMQAAHHFKLLIELRRKDPSYEGIHYDYMACLTMLAFALEAQINFIGYKCIKEWNEKAFFPVKLDCAIKFLEIDFDKQKRPFSSLERLKHFRNSVAHGKPEESEIETTIEGTEFQSRLELNASWDQYCTYEIVCESYDDLDEFWKLMIESSPIESHETVTNGGGSVTYLKE